MTTASSRDNGTTFGSPYRHGSGSLPALATSVRGTYVGRSSYDGTDNRVELRALRQHHVLGAGLPASLTIPDGSAGGFTATLDVVDGSVLSDVGVWVDLSHTNRSQLTVELTAPSGTIYTLAQGGSAVPWDGRILFSDAGIAPMSALAALVGQPLDGVWTLTVIDASVGVGGSLRDWGIRFK